ncbi:MAG: ADP-forming succinate--CoA ligase subunit beta [Lentimicrobiaceae bacterium]|nr:ADP-forming succinate--CoA ligase subunit beta [Lentimicrobiaceae bacterium]
MNLHEYQAKEILASYNVDIPIGIVAHNVSEAIEAAKQIKKETNSDFCVIKAQIHAGGRGKGGGVKLAKSLKDVEEIASQILGMTLVTPQTGPKGKLVRKVLVQQDVYYPGNSPTQEFYVSLLLNRAENKIMIMYSPDGGMDIEAVAEKTPERIFIELIEPSIGLQTHQCRKVAFNLGLSGLAFKNMVKFVQNLYNAYIGADFSLLEINPVLKTSDDKILAVDSKVKIDDNAMYRHPDFVELRDIHEEDPAEVEAGKHDLNYVKLDGNVGCMVNGAGLAMATMDIIKLSGGEPANFLDVGGSANAERVEQAFRIILNDKSVKAILVNIFGGIVRCDRVAQGIVDAYKNIGNIEVPIIVRLQGTNATEGKEMIKNSGLNVLPAIELQEAADLINQVLK